MAKFWNYEDFYGDWEAYRIENRTPELIAFAAGMREKLGEKGSLLEEYLACVLNGIYAVFANLSAEGGLKRVLELRDAVGRIYSGAPRPGSKSLLYEEVRAHIDAYPADKGMDAHAASGMYAVELADANLRACVDEFRASLASQLPRELDIERLRELRLALEAEAGAESVDALDGLIHARFMPFSAIDVFVQQEAISLLSVVVMEDARSGRPYSVLALDRFQNTAF